MYLLNLIVFSTRNARMARTARNILRIRKMAAPLKPLTFWMIRGSAKSTIPQRTMTKSARQHMVHICHRLLNINNFTYYSLAYPTFLSRFDFKTFNLIPFEAFEGVESALQLAIRSGLSLHVKLSLNFISTTRHYAQLIC